MGIITIVIGKGGCQEPHLLGECAMGTCASPEVSCLGISAAGVNMDPRRLFEGILPYNECSRFPIKIAYFP